MMGVHHVPTEMELPIPEDVQPGPGWTMFMVELAAHIGPYDVLRICAEFGGRELYIPAEATRNPMLPLLGAQKAAVVSWAYRCDTVAVPTARYALNRAKRGGVIAAARAKSITVTDAARILKLRRDYVSRLVNQTPEGEGSVPIFRKAIRSDPRQIDMFPDEGGRVD